MKRSRLQLLQEMPIFGGVDELALEFILDSAQIINISKDQFFFHEEELATAMYVLDKGKVEILRIWQGKQYLLNYLNPGDCFGEMALMGFKPRSASVRALQDCSAIEITTDLFSGLFNAYPQQFTMIQMNMGREVCRRLCAADTRLFLLDIKEDE